MQHLTLKKEDKTQVIQSLNRIMGQLEAIKQEILDDEACDETLTQLLAVRGGVARVGKDLVGMGILSCLSKYNRKELEQAIEKLLKMS